MIKVSPSCSETMGARTETEVIALLTFDYLYRRNFFEGPLGGKRFSIEKFLL